MKALFDCSYLCSMCRCTELLLMFQKTQQRMEVSLKARPAFSTTNYEIVWRHARLYLYIVNWQLKKIKVILFRASSRDCVDFLKTNKTNSWSSKISMVGTATTRPNWISIFICLSWRQLKTCRIKFLRSNPIGLHCYSAYLFPSMQEMSTMTRQEVF